MSPPKRDQAPSPKNDTVSTATSKKVKTEDDVDSKTTSTIQGVLKTGNGHGDAGNDATSDEGASQENPPAAKNAPASPTKSENAPDDDDDKGDSNDD